MNDLLRLEWAVNRIRSCSFDLLVGFGLEHCTEHSTSGSLSPGHRRSEKQGKAKRVHRSSPTMIVISKSIGPDAMGACHSIL